MRDQSISKSKRNVRLQNAGVVLKPKIMEARDQAIKEAQQRLRDQIEDFRRRQAEAWKKGD